MKKLSLILTLVLVFGMIAALSACGADPEPAAPAPAAPAAQATPAPPAEATLDPDADGIEPGASLIYWSMWSEAEPQAIVLAAAARAFTEQTGVPITINFNGRQGQREGLAPALAAGETIDIFDEDVDRVFGQWGEHLLPLDGLVNGVFSDTHGQTFRSLLNEGIFNMVLDRTDGNYVVVPYQPFIFTTMFNRGLFEEAGIDGVPTTWDEFIAACEALLAIGITPMTVDNAYIPAKFGYVMTRIIGVERTLEIFASGDLSDPGVLRTAEIFEDMISRGFISPRAATNVFPEGQASEFAMETVAIIVNGTWLPNELREINPDIQWGSFSWPTIDAGGAGPEAHNLGTQCFGINRNTNYPNAAFAFLRFVTLGHWDQILANDTLGVPMAVETIWPPELAMAEGVFAATTNVFPWAAGAEDDPNITAALIEGFQRMVAGTINAQQFADSLAALN